MFRSFTVGSFEHEPLVKLIVLIFRNNARPGRGAHWNDAGSPTRRPSSLWVWTIWTRDRGKKADKAEVEVFEQKMELKRTPLALLELGRA